MPFHIGTKLTSNVLPGNQTHYLNTILHPLNYSSVHSWLMQQPNKGNNPIGNF